MSIESLTHLPIRYGLRGDDTSYAIRRDAAELARRIPRMDHSSGTPYAIPAMPGQTLTFELTVSQAEDWGLVARLIIHRRGKESSGLADCELCPILMLSSKPHLGGPALSQPLFPPTATCQGQRRQLCGTLDRLRQPLHRGEGIDRSTVGVCEGKGRGGPWVHPGGCEPEAAGTLRFGGLSGDEYFVSERAAKEGVRIMDASSRTQRRTWVKRASLWRCLELLRTSAARRGRT